MAIEPVGLESTSTRRRRGPFGSGAAVRAAVRQPLPLVLLGHGAHLSKDDAIMQMLARRIARGIPAGVALMDCPGHGERRPAGLHRRGIRARRRAPHERSRRRRGARRGLARGRRRARAPRRRCSPAASATRASRWARCSACRSSPTCPKCAPRVRARRHAGRRRVRPRGPGARNAQRARRREPPRGARGADAQHDARRALPDRGRDRACSRRFPARSAWACGPARTTRSRPRRSSWPTSSSPAHSLT